MILKASLHIHTKEDKRDGHMINYSVYDLVDEAKKRGFDVLGYTPHERYVFKEEFADYARRNGILLIPGIELSLGRVLHKHVIVLNCDRTAENIKSFKALFQYKRQHPEVFVLAPHPTYSRFISMGADILKKYINLFDAVEHSWFYSFRFNSNQKARLIAKENKKPFIATADVHVLKKLNTDYALIDADSLSAEAIFKAIKNNDFENVTFPKSFIRMMAYAIIINFKYIYKYALKLPVLLKIRSLLLVRVEAGDNKSG